MSTCVSCGPSRSASVAAAAATFSFVIGMTSSARCSSIAASFAPSISAHSLNLSSMNAGRYVFTSSASTESICAGSACTNAFANASRSSPTWFLIELGIGLDADVQLVELALARVELLAHRGDPLLELADVEVVRAHPHAEVVLEVARGARGIGGRVVEDHLRAIAREEALEVLHQLGHAALRILATSPSPSPTAGTPPDRA